MINLKTTNQLPISKKPARFASLDFARGIAIVIMLFLHIIQRTLDIDALMDTINNQAIINLFALILIPFFGGLAGFFLIISAASNMVSMMKHLRKGRPVGGLVVKQIIGGFLLLIFAMLIEGLIGYQGLIGVFARSLDDPLATDWTVMLWRWNFFETIHTIAWCIILNGIVHGLLSLKGRWQKTNQLIISYIVLAVLVVGLTQPIWILIGRIIPYYPSLGPYPFGTFPNGHTLYLPWIGSESFWEILRTPFINALAAPMEPIFPYLAVSFVGSIIGIIISKPKEEISQKFPRRLFLIGLTMFLAGLLGIVIVITMILNGSPNFDTGFERFITLYMEFPNHRAWAADFASFVPPFAWLGQFFAVNGFSVILIAILFRLVEFRGASVQFASKTKIIRRFGTIALTNYNNQYLYFVVFFFTSWLSTGEPYQLQKWWATFLTIIITYLIYGSILYFWEKINYFLSLEWFIRTITNNLVPARRKTFDPSTKWWQRGLVDVQNTFYDVNWINLSPSDTIPAGSIESLDSDSKESMSDAIKTRISINDSRFSLILSIVGLCSILFVIVSFIALPIAIHARKTEGKNKQNAAAIVISSIAITIFLAVIIVTAILPIGALGIF